MALIGTMKYLTIGDKTYEIEGEQLSIASASTLGGIKVGSGLSINSTTGVLNALVQSVNGQTGAVSITVPTKVSDLTNDSGFITSYTETDPVFSASPAAGISAENISNWDEKAAIWTVGSGHASSDYWWTLAVSRSALYKISNAPGSDGYLKSIKVPSVNGSQMVTLDLPTTNGKLALTSQIPTVPTNISAFTNDAGYLTSYTETDPIFSASAAAGITSTDIGNWNSIVSDTGKWNGVTLNKTYVTSTAENIRIPYSSAVTDTSMNFINATYVPSANQIVRYNATGYLISITPSANDNSTKVATTAYVDTAIPKVYSSTNTGGYLTMATLPIYDGTVV